MDRAVEGVGAGPVVSLLMLMMLMLLLLMLHMHLLHLLMVRLHVLLLLLHLIHLRRVHTIATLLGAPPLLRGLLHFRALPQRLSDAAEFRDAGILEGGGAGAFAVEDGVVHGVVHEGGAEAGVDAQLGCFARGVGDAAEDLEGVGDSDVFGAVGEAHEEAVGGAHVVAGELFVGVGGFEVDGEEPEEEVDGEAGEAPEVFGVEPDLGDVVFDAEVAVARVLCRAATG